MGLAHSHFTPLHNIRYGVVDTGFPQQTDV
jgi:hypothetical protein